MIKSLGAVNSWCGETHIQKAIYLLQSIGRIDLEYEFVLYKHGPFAFDLATDIASMRSSHIFEFVFIVPGYGPSVRLTQVGIRILDSVKPFVEPLIPVIRFISDWIGPHDVKYLERVATAHYIMQGHPNEEAGMLAARLRALKPHISEYDSLTAVDQLEEKLAALETMN